MANEIRRFGMRQTQTMSGVVRKTIGHACFFEHASNGAIDVEARSTRAQLFLAGRHRRDTQFEEPLLIWRRRFSNNHRVGKVAAVAADHDGIVQDKHVAWLNDTVRGTAAVALRARTDCKVAIDDDRPAGGLYAGGVDAAVNV